MAVELWNLGARRMLSLKRLVGTEIAILSLLTLPRRQFWRAAAKLGVGVPVPV